MKIAVLNGSPKGDVGVTRQYVLHLEKAFPQHQFRVLHVAQQSWKLAENASAFDEVIQEVGSADGVIWAFPVYYLLVSSQYKRFIELIMERGAQSAFRGKHAVTLSTSIHFHDYTAHVYMRSVCEDLGMRFVGIHSANMHDLMKKEERQRLRLFAEDFFTAIERGLELPRVSAVLPGGALPGGAPPAMGTEASPPAAGYRAASPVLPVDARGRKIVIVTDARPGQPGYQSLQAMTTRLQSAWGGAAQTVNLWDIDIKGGCQGCLRCGAANQCAYAGKDGFIDFYNSILVPADIMVFAGSIVARQLSWKWRELFDRSFFNCHTPSLRGKQLAFVISGPLSLLPELREGYEAWFEVQESNLVGFVSDEAASDAVLDQFAQRMVRLSESGYIRPQTFLGVGGMKIFRDDLWSELKVIFRADHRAYKQRGYYDFPQRKIARRIVARLAYIITGLPGIRSRFPSMIRAHMSMPMRKAALADHP